MAANRIYILICNHCGKKILTDGSILPSLTPIISCTSCHGKKLYRCTSCGYAMTLSKATTAVLDSSLRALEKMREDKALHDNKLQEELKRLAREKQAEDERNEPK